MNFSSLDPTLREWLFAREMMRRLGFSADDLYFIVTPPGKKLIEDDGNIVDLPKPLLSLQLRYKSREFNWIIGLTDIPDRDILKVYEQACDFWNNAEREDCTKEFHKSKVYEMRYQLLLALRNKGFSIQEPN